MSTRETRDSAKEQVVFATEPGLDSLHRSWEEAANILRSNKLELDKPYQIELGLKKWRPTQGSHRAVIIKVKDAYEEKMAFRIELEIDLRNEERNYIIGTFECQDSKCSFSTDSFIEFANHHWKNHRNRDGDNVQHTCCNQEFPVFESFAAHMYENHQNTNKITLQFQRVFQEKYEKFLDKQSVTFFPAHTKTITFRQLLMSGLTIMKNFGNYFIFFWNCQDFAAWYLVFNGIPLNTVEPTLPDHLTASGTGSGARSVRDAKGMMWYKKQDQLKEFKLQKWKGDVLCNFPGCKYLPAMDMKAYEIHHNIAHSKPTEKLESFLWTACGKRTGLNLDEEEQRRFTFYLWRGRNPIGHTSLICQPWRSARVTREDDGTYTILQEETPLNYYHTIDLRYHQPLNNQQGWCEVDCQAVKRPANITKECIVLMTAQELAKMVQSQLEIHGSYRQVDRNCHIFCQNLIRSLEPYIIQHKKTKLVTHSIDLEPDHPRLSPLNMDMAKYKSTKPMTHSTEYKRPKISPTHKEQEKDRKVNLNRFGDLVKETYPMIRAAGLLHPMWLLLVHGFEPTHIFHMLVSLWMSLYGLLQIYEDNSSLPKIGYLACSKNIRKDSKQKMLRLFLNNLALFTLSVTFHLSILYYVSFDLNKLAGGLFLQYVMTMLRKFQQCLASLKKDVGLVKAKKKQIHWRERQQLIPLVFTELIECGALIFLNCIGIALVFWWPSVSVVFTAIILASSLILSNAKVMASLKLPRVSLDFFTGFSSKVNILVYIGYILGLSWTWNSTLSGKTLYSPCVTMPLFIRYILSINLNEDLNNEGFFQEQLDSARTAVFKEVDQGMSEFQNLLRFISFIARRADKISQFAIITFYVVFVGLFFMPYAAVPICLTLLFLHCSSKYISLRNALFMFVLNEILLKPPDVRGFFSRIFFQQKFRVKLSGKDNNSEKKGNGINVADFRCN